MRLALSGVVLLALLFLLLVPGVSSGPYVYDEADYMYAASLGYLANYTDTPTLSIVDFLRTGLDRGRAAGQRQTLSELIRASNDMVFYRHWHGPLFHYLLIPISRLHLTERGTRSVMLVIPSLSLMVMYFGFQWLVGRPQGILPAILSSMLFLSSHAVVWSTELAPHQLFVLWSLCSLIFLVKAVSTGRRVYWYLAVSMAGLAFSTLEIAFVLIITLAICAYIERRRWNADWRFAGQSLGVFVGTVLLVWPAAIFKLSFLKAYIVMAYLALVRNSSWGDMGFLETWRRRLLDSPLEWALILAALILYKQRKLAFPVLLFGVLMVGATLRVFTGTPRYSLPFMPAFDLLVGLVSVTYITSQRKLAVVMIALYAIAAYQVFSRPHDPNPHPRQVLTYVHEHGFDDQAILAPQEDLPMLHYYFPRSRLRGYYGQRPTASESAAFAPDAVVDRSP